MDLLICHSCGTMLRGKPKTCSGCSLAVLGVFGFVLPTLSRGSGVLAVAIKPDPITVERLLVKNQSELWLKEVARQRGGLTPVENGNGYGNGNGNGHVDADGNGNGHEPGSSYESAEPSRSSLATEAPAAPSDFAPPDPTTDHANNTPMPRIGADESFASSPPVPTEAPQAFAPTAANQQVPLGLSTALGGAAASAAGAAAGAAFGSMQPAPSTESGTGRSGWEDESVIGLSPPRQESGDFFAGASAGPSAAAESKSAPDFFEPSHGNQLARAAGSNGLSVTPGTDSGNFPFEPTEKPTQTEPAQSREVPEAPPGMRDAAPPVVPTSAPPKASPAMPSPMEMDFFAATAAPTTTGAPAPVPQVQQSSTGSQQQMGLYEDSSGAASPAKFKKTMDEDFPFEPGPETTISKVKKEKRRSVEEDEEDDDDGFMRDEEPVSKKKRPQQQAVEETDEEHDDDDADGVARPPRRSFTPNSSTAPTAVPKFKGRPPAKKDTRKSIDEDDEDNRPTSSSAGLGMLDAEVNVLGFPMKRKLQIILIGLCLLLCPAIFQVIGGVFGAASGILPGGQQSSPDLGLSGDWMMTIQENPNHIIPSKFQIDTYGGGLVGQGVDTDSGVPYQLKGQVIPPNKIAFYKYYPPKDPQHPEKPIVYQGLISAQEGQLPEANGQWSVTKGVGVFLNRQTVTLAGPWHAQLTHVRPAGWTGSPASGTSNVATVSMQPGKGSSTGGFGPEMFGKIVVFLLVVAIILVVVVWQLFSPNGILAVREKNRYVPSQYRQDHHKQLKMMTKPVMPGSLPLGIRCEWAPWKFWEKKEVSLSPELRKTDPHVLILGSGDKGKTRYIAHMIAHDIESNDRAVVVVDSDGSLVDLVMRWMSHHPKGKMFAKRVVMLDPTNKNGSLGYNPLEMPEDNDLQAAASSLVYGFKAIYTEPPGSQSQWNAQTANILRNSALLLMANGKTLTDLPTLLQDNDFRDILLENVEKKRKEKVEYTTLIDTWGQYKRLARTDQWINWVEPILNRVGPMLSDPRIRPILTKPRGDIKLIQVIKNKQILLVKIAKGQLDQNANLLGSLIVTGIKQAALALSGDPGQKPVNLYLDEFDNLIETDTIEAITTETERFLMGLVGSIKTLQHLPEDFRNKLISNVGTWSCFALSKKDADLLGPQMFRVDGRKIRHQTMANFFNPVNTTPQFELISDEEKLNIDRVVGQDTRHFYCYRVGTQAGVFRCKSHEFRDLDDKEVNWKLIEKMHSNSGFGDKTKDREASKSTEEA